MRKAITMPRSGRSARIASTNSGARSFSGCNTGMPASRAATFTSLSRSFCPRPAGLSGAVTTATTLYPPSTRARSEGTANSGVPMKTMRSCFGSMKKMRLIVWFVPARPCAASAERRPCSPGIVPPGRSRTPAGSVSENRPPAQWQQTQPADHAAAGPQQHINRESDRGNLRPAQRRQARPGARFAPPRSGRPHRVRPVYSRTISTLLPPGSSPTLSK